MGTDIISIIVILAAVVMYCIKKIPIWITSIVVMLVMVWTGCIDYATAYSGFSNKVIMLIIGMGILGQACVDTGLAQRIGFALSKLVGTSETKAVFMVTVVSAIMGIFLNGALVVAIMLPIIDCMVVTSNGAITRKHTYFPCGIAAVMGNGTTAFSASSMVTCVAMLTEAGYREIGAFEPAKVTGVAFVAFIVFYMVVCYPLSKKIFDYPDPPLPGGAVVATEYDAEAYPVWKQIVTGLTLVGVIVALVSGANFGAPPLLGAVIVSATNCIDPKKAVKSVDWTTVIVVAAAIGFSGALKATGGGLLLANWIIDMAGPLGQSEFGLMVIVLIIAALLSALLSDNATVAAIVPIVLSICGAQGWDPIPMVIAAACGLKICQFLTPVCTGCVTQTVGGGYRTKDFLILGGLISLVTAIIVIIMLAIVY